MEIKTYAPVIIPTLNRYDHFRQCIESLENCTGADKTVVYIGLDYPPAEKYVEGWKKIDDYLKDKECSNKFKQFVVFRREHNCGIGNENSNSNLLKKYVSKKYDRYIFSEDDNVFSPNFLEFINKGLEKYYTDKNVFAINGYCHCYNFKFNDNSHFLHNVDFSAWGYGIWVDRYNQCVREIRDGYLRSSLSIKNILKLQKVGWNRLLDFIVSALQPDLNKFRITDCVLTVYMNLKDFNVIMPRISKVRNIGWDMQGHSFEKSGMSAKQRKLALMHKNQVIDNNSHFSYRGNPSFHYEWNRDIAVKSSDGKISFYSFMKHLFLKVPILLLRNIKFRIICFSSKFSNGIVD